MDVARVAEHAVEVAPAVALVGAARAASRAHGLHRVRLQQPVGDVDDVDVLLDDDVAGEHPVVDPVAQPPLGGRGVRPVGPLEGRGEVVDLARDRLPICARVDALRQLDVGRGVADLEADREAQLAPSPSRRAPSPSCSPGRPRPPASRGRRACRRRRRPRGGRVEVGRRRDVDGVDVLRGEQLLGGLRALEQARGVDARACVLRRHGVELAFAGLQRSGNRSPSAVTTAPVFSRNEPVDVAAAAAAAEQAEPHGGVGLGAKTILGFRIVMPAAAAAAPTNSRRPTPCLWDRSWGSPPLVWSRSARAGALE